MASTACCQAVRAVWRTRRYPQFSMLPVVTLLGVIIFAVVVNMIATTPAAAVGGALHRPPNGRPVAAVTTGVVAIMLSITTAAVARWAARRLVTPGSQHPWTAYPSERVAFPASGSMLREASVSALGGGKFSNEIKAINGG